MKYIMILALALSFSTGFASDKPALGEWITTEVNGQIDEFNKMEESEATMNQGWYFNKVRVRLRGTVGLDLFAKFEVKPYLELHFKRSNPDGYTKYKPSL
ncbi:MAG: hypothetical protein ACO20H_00245 [Bacteriovoracaceae bacterium]